MNAFTGRLLTLEESIARKKGPFILFAVLKVHPVVDAWNLVVCAEWIEHDIAYAIDFIAKQLYKTFPPAERGRIMRIATVAPDNPDLLDVLDQYEADHEVKKMRRGHYFQQNIEQGYLFTARRQQTEPG
ncbi:hypothetical protein HF313_06530 [Massilia atriviolacea]|uniref:Uncharacterized protein n=1 Tax=Massilia atriviolacea TaxID=2495579 RepID=A0A430HCX6_9BURK|nr:hypothetical protein [Massilia atriviolacea]RSZ55339.1 hypothetical protein EJB06_30150 [Massilia atriviolacea]